MCDKYHYLKVKTSLKLSVVAAGISKFEKITEVCKKLTKF